MRRVALIVVTAFLAGLPVSRDMPLLWLGSAGALPADLDVVLAGAGAWSLPAACSRGCRRLAAMLCLGLRDSLPRNSLDLSVRKEPVRRRSPGPMTWGSVVGVKPPHSNIKLQLKQLEALAKKLPKLDAPARVSSARPLPAKKRYTPPEHEQAIVAEYQVGTTTYQLARKYGIHRNTIGRILKRRGVEMRMQGLSPAQVSEAVGLYEGGWSLARIGEHLHVDANTVRARLLERGVRMRDTQGRER